MAYQDPIDKCLKDIDKHTPLIFSDGVEMVELKATEHAYRVAVIDLLNKRKILATEDNISKGVMFAKLFEIECGLQLFEIDGHEDA